MLPAVGLSERASNLATNLHLSPGSQRVNLTNPRPTVYANQRRSQRIMLAVPVVVSGRRANNAPFAERTSTLIVNAHGALIQLQESVLRGRSLRMRNVATGSSSGLDSAQRKAGYELHHIN